jgi:hypothetical protein
MRELLVDTLQFKIDPLQIQESITKNNGLIFVEGTLQRYGAKNGNGRIYPEEVLRREDEKYQEAIRENRSWGELDHSSESVINLKNVSHRILKTWWVGQDLKGKLQIITNTPSGNILKALLESGGTLGISSRGLGSVKQIGETVEVQDDFELLCYDFVSTPSTQGAFMRVVKESKEYKELQNRIEKYNNINKIINDIITYS